MTPLVLVHGGGFDSRCWDLLLPHLAAPAIAVDLPGRGRRPGPLSSTIAWAQSANVTESTWTRPASRRSCSSAIRRVRHAVFVACIVPKDGNGTMDELAPDVRAHVESSRAQRRQTMDPAQAKALFGNDLDDEQFAWCLERMVPEAVGLTTEPVDLSGLRSAVPRTWVRTTQDAIQPPELQQRFASNVGECWIIDIDAGHMCMISQPKALAGILHGFTARRR